MFATNISKFPSHENRRVVTYNFFISQRRELIFSENKTSNTLQLHDLKEFPGIHLFQHRNTGLEVAKVQLPRPSFVEKSLLLMQLFFGVTILRIISLP